MMKDGYPLTKKSIRYRFKRIYPKKYTFGANKNLTGLKTYLRTEVLIDNHYNPLNPEKLVSFIKVHPFKEPWIIKLLISCNIYKMQFSAHWKVEY